MPATVATPPTSAEHGLELHTQSVQGQSHHIEVVTIHPTDQGCPKALDAIATLRSKGDEHCFRQRLLLECVEGRESLLPTLPGPAAQRTCTSCATAHSACTGSTTC